MDLMILLNLPAGWCSGGTSLLGIRNFGLDPRSGNSFFTSDSVRALLRGLPSNEMLGDHEAGE